MTDNEYYDGIIFIREQLDLEERLTALAEEAAELSQAALKFRRAMNGKNPTPTTQGEALYNLYEEASDVFNCISVIGFNIEYIHEIQFEKLERWVQRLKERERNDNSDCN